MTWSFPTPHEHTFDNGLTALIYPVPGQYVSATRLVIPAPLAQEPRDKEGVATLVSRTMDEGTERRTGDEMAEALERNGIGLGAGTSEAGLMLDMDATVSQLGPGLELLAECLTMPVFDESEVGRHRRQRLVEIEHAMSVPASRAALEWVRTRYAASERASRASGGEAETVASVTRADCAEFHARQVAPQGATVVVAGDLEVNAALASVEKTLGAWTVSSNDRAAKVDLPGARRPYDLAPDRGRVVVIDRPGSVQTEMYLGAGGPGRATPEGWGPYRALSYLIGGSPNARIDAVLREDKGYTYGIRSTFRPRLSGGEVLITGSVRGDVTAESLELLYGVLDEVATDGFTTDEVESAINYIGKTAPARYATADVIADEAATLAAEGLRTDFVTNYLEDLKTLNPDRLQRVWAPILDQPWSVVLVGDAEKFVDDLRAQGRGEVTVVS